MYSNIIFLNIEWTWTCSFIDDHTRRSWLRTNGHSKSNIKGLYWIMHPTDSNIIFSNIEQSRTCSLNMNTLFLALNDRKSNFEHSSSHHYKTIVNAYFHLPVFFCIFRLHWVIKYIWYFEGWRCNLKPHPIFRNTL